MSLLDQNPGNEPCIVFMEEAITDIDGNVQTKASASGIPAVARFQFTGQSGTSSRKQEQDSEGFETEKIYSMKLPRWWTAQYGLIGAQAEIQWGTDSMGRPARWALYGDARHYNASPRIAHVEYMISRT